MEPIKIVYSWIGPRGPIVNTELPNILSFSGVAEGAASSSRLFWADDLYWRVFLHNGNFPLASTAHVDNKDVFVYPFTLVWRITFNNYFLSNSGLLEFSHTPNHIIHQVRTGKGFFLLDMTAEAYVTDGHLRAIHSYFSNNHQIPMGKIIYLTGCMNPDKIYNDFCRRNGIPDDPMQRMNLISFPISQHALFSHMPSMTEPIYDENKLPEKLFLSFNRRFRRHRTSLLLGLDKAGLVDRSYISLCKVDPEQPTVSFANTIDLFYNPFLSLEAEDADRLVNKLPLVVDGETEINQMCQDFDSAARNFYQNSLVSIVTETNYEVSELTLTEKAFKPAKEKHPFIIVGVAGALKAMREFGFKTFNEFWDESYDDIEEPKLRMFKIIETCKQIGSWNNDQILEFKHKVKPILEHNYQALRKDTSKFVADRVANAIWSRL